MKIEASGLTIPFDLYTGGYGTKDNPRRLHQKQYEFKQRLDRMVSKGLLKKVKSGGKLAYDLTEKGEDAAERISIGNLTIEKPWRWNGKWHMVAFDIAERKRDARDELRSILETIGFVHIQKSVWIYPYECREAIELIRRKHHLTYEVRYFEVDGVEFDTELREHFELPK